MPETTPPATSASLCRNLAQQVFLLLASEPDAPQIPVPRRWLAQWYQTLQQVIGLLDERL